MENIHNQNPENETPTLNKEVIQMNVDEAQGNVKSKSMWFFWISGLSFINSFLAAKGLFFILGLAISQVIDSIVITLTGEVNYFVSLLAPCLFITFGLFAWRLNRWAFIVGSIVYFLDFLIYLYFQAWLAAGIHILVFYKLYQGYKEITEYEEQRAKLN